MNRIHDTMKPIGKHVDWRWYAWFVLVTAAIYQFSLPIAVLDTDMWYHLSDGRYFLENGEWPYHTYFSFIDPPRELLNHWWFYQPAVTLVFESFGYLGLVCLRAGFFLLACYFIYRLLLEDDPRNRASAICFFVFALVLVILHYRGVQLRPYLLTYIFVAVFLFVLERKPRLVYLLPLLSILWANSHGVGWPIAAVICGAYFAGWAHATYVRKQPEQDRGPVYGLCLVLCGFGFVVNPIGPQLFLEPFRIAPDLSKFISEIQPLSPRLMTQFIAQFGSFGNLSVVSIFSAITLYASIYLLLRRKLSLTHLLLLIGGVLLLLRAGRFLQIWMLLCLPMLRAFALEYRWKLQWTWAPSVVAVTVIAIWVLVLPPYHFLKKVNLDRSYPLDTLTTPAGSTAFLGAVGGGGNILAMPGLAGYLEWYLLPDYRVYADMRLNRYSYKVLTAFRDIDALKTFNETYQIDFLLIPLSATGALDRIRESELFAPVFFDDKTILLASRARKLGLIQSFGYSALDLKNLLKEIDTEAVDADALISELKRTVELFPAGFWPRLALMKHLFDAARYEEAERHVDIMLESFPWSVNALTFKGNILENTDRCEQAIEYFQMALKHSDRNHKRNVMKHIGACHYLLKNHAAAYKVFHKAMNPYARAEEPEYMYQYAFVAAYNGYIQRAIRILELLLLTVDKEESAELKEKAESFLTHLRGPEFGDSEHVPFFGRLLGRE